MSDDLSNFSLLELFREEANSQLAVLNDGLLALEEAPGERTVVESLMRAAHSLKGAARIVNLDPVVQLAHRLEDCFVAALEGAAHFDGERITVLFSAVDLLGKLSRFGETELKNWLDGGCVELKEMLPKLERLLTAGGAAAPASAESEPADLPELPAETPQAPAFDLANASLLELFRGEAETQTAAMTEGLLALEGDTTAVELISGLMRAAHSLKGAARIAGLDPVVGLAHVMEDCFVAAQEGKIVLSPEGIDVLLKSNDLLKDLGTVTEDNLPGWLTARHAEFGRFVSDLNKVKAGQAISTTAAPGRSPAPAAAPPVAAAPVPPTATPKAEAEKKTAPTEGAERKAARSGDAAGGERAVRVSAENLNRLMELAAESLVEARRLEPSAQALTKLRTTHSQMENALNRLFFDLERSVASRGLTEPVAEIQQKADLCRTMLAEWMENLDGFISRSSHLSNRLYQEVLQSRMRPFSEGVTGFPRLVRDLARTLGKKVKFTIAGKTTKVDRDILEKLEAPLNHILRNAMDHGVEQPWDRTAAGKGEDASLILEAKHRSGMLMVTVSDDGRGIDPERIRQKVITKSMVTREAAAKLTNAELYEFMFLPGFSTAEKVTEISGRGVGLDVVQTMVQEVGGTIRVVSALGRGTSFELSLPVTRSVIRALIVKIANEAYALPLARVERVLRVTGSELRSIEGRQYITFDDRSIGLVPAFQVLELEDPPPQTGGVVSIVVLSDRSNHYGLEVDCFVGEKDLVVRPVDARLGKVPDVAAASVLEDGSPILILDVDDMARSIDNLSTHGNLPRSRRKKGRGQGTQKRVLVVDDSITVREVQRQLLQAKGYHVETAVDGMEGWHAVRLGSYDLVISDVDMPRMTGIEFVRRIRAEERLSNLPVIIVSYKDRDEDRLRGLEAGANYYLTKSSFQDDTFLRAVVDLAGEASG